MVEEEEDEEGKEGAAGVEEGIPGGSVARRDEGLMDFVQGGVARGDEPGGEGPGPVPADTRAANAAIKQSIKDEEFSEMRGLADIKVDDFKGRIAEGGREPAKNDPENGGGVFRRKRVRGSEEDDGTPEQCGPPGAEPAGKHGIGWNAVTDFVESGGGRRIAPGIGRGH